MTVFILGALIGAVVSGRICYAIGLSRSLRALGNAERRERQAVMRGRAGTRGRGW